MKIFLEKDELLNEPMNHKAVCRTAPALPGLSKRRTIATNKVTLALIGWSYGFHFWWTVQCTVYSVQGSEVKCTVHTLQYTL